MVSFASPALKRLYAAVPQVCVVADSNSVFGQGEPGSRNKVSLYKGSAMALPADEVVPGETARLLGCDGALVGIVEDEYGTPLHVRRRTRAIPPALKPTLEPRHRGCRFPGCISTRFVECHQLKHWAHEGETRLDNRVTLSGYHYRLVQGGGFGVEAVAGNFHFFIPAGVPITPTPTFPRKPHNGKTGLIRQNKTPGPDIEASTAPRAGAGRP